MEESKSQITVLVTGVLGFWGFGGVAPSAELR